MDFYHNLTVEYMGARQLVENHFVDMTIDRIRLLVDATLSTKRKIRYDIPSKLSTQLFYIYKKKLYTSLLQDLNNHAT